MTRGQLTPEIAQLAESHLGWVIDQTELRMMPYVQYVMMNAQKIDPLKCNAADRAVLSKWRKAGYITGGASGLTITKEFWDILHTILWESYVNY